MGGLSWNATVGLPTGTPRTAVAGVERAAPQDRSAVAPPAVGVPRLLDTRGWAASTRANDAGATALAVDEPREALIPPPPDVPGSAATPAPTRVPGPRLPRAAVERIIRAAAAAWGTDPDQLLRVAWCESRFDPNAYNPRAGDAGLFQFIPRTWAKNSPLAGFAGASPFDPVANAHTAAMLFAKGDKAWMWTCK